MKRAIRTTLPRLMILALAWISLAAQAETFDLVTFDTPSGTRTQLSEALGFTDAEPTTFVTYSLYKGVPGSNDPARDFADEWQLLVANNYSVTGELKSETVDWFGGWKLTMGAAKVWGEQQRNFVSLLNVFTGYGYKVSVLINYNDDLYRPKIDKFIASLKLQPPAATQATMPAPLPAATATDEVAGAPSLTSQEWYRSQANYSHWGTDFSALQIARIGSQGYARWSYRFSPDGSYSFTSEFWSMNKHKEYWFVEESGRYRQTADTIEVTPRQARRVLRNREGQQQGEAQPLKLEPATYRYKFHYLSGMQEWYLMLMPVNGRDTERDGSRSDITGVGKAYQFGSRPRCERKPKPTDCKV